MFVKLANKISETDEIVKYLEKGLLLTEIKLLETGLEIEYLKENITKLNTEMQSISELTNITNLEIATEKCSLDLIKNDMLLDTIYQKMDQIQKLIVHRKNELLNEYMKKYNLMQYLIEKDDYGDD